MNCWLCKKPKQDGDNTDPHKMCERCAAKLQGEIRLSPLETSTPLTHEEWVERGKRTANDQVEFQEGSAAE